MRSVLAISAFTLLLASAAFAGDGPDSGQWRVVRDWTVWPGVRYVRIATPHHHCVIQNVCSTDYYAYGHWTGMPKGQCICR